MKAPGQIVLKTEKDFRAYAKQIADRLAVESVDKKKDLEEGEAMEFINEMVLLMYRGLKWENIAEIQEKMKAVKNDRKTL